MTVSRRHCHPQDPHPHLRGSSLLASTSNQLQTRRALSETSARKRSVPPRGLHHLWPEGAASGRRHRGLDPRSPSMQGAIASWLLPLRTALARRRCGHEPNASPAAPRAAWPHPRCHTRSLPCRSVIGSPAHAQVCGQERRPDDSRRALAPRGVRSGIRGIQGSDHRKSVCCRLSWLWPWEFLKSCATFKVTGCRCAEALPEGRHAAGARA